MKRIRYFKQDDGSFKTKPMPGNKDIVTAVTNGLEWKVLSSTNETLASGTAKSDAHMKRQVKDALKLQGVPMLDEVKQRKSKPDADFPF